MSNSVDREIRITASDTGVFDRLQKLKESALAMGRGIAEDSRKQATSSRELIKLMNDEIALIEKRNRLNKEARELSAREKHSGSALQSELQKISIESKEDKIQSDLLKQILQAVLKTSQEEVTANKEGVRQRIQSDKAIDQMEDHEEALQQMMSKRILEDVDKEGKSGNVGRGGGGSSAINTMGGFIRETDAYTLGYSGASEFMKKRAGRVDNKLASGLLTAGGVILGSAAMAIGPASEELESMGDLSRSTGMSKSEADAFYGSASVGTDLTDAQTYKRISQFNLARGGRMSNSQAADLLRFERSNGIDGTQLASMSKYSDGDNTTDLFGMIKAVMGDRGMSQAKVADMLGAANQMSSGQFMATGMADNYANIGIINQIMSGQKIKSPERAMATIGRSDAMVKGGNEQLEAIKFSEFQRKNGGSYFDYLVEKEKGAAGEIDDMVVNKIMSGPGSEHDKKLSLFGAGFSAHDAEEIIRGGGVSPKMPKGGGKQIMSEAAIASSRGESKEYGLNEITYSSAAVSNGFAEAGKAAIDFADWMVTTTVKGKNSMGNFFEWIEGMTPKSNSITK